MLQQTNNQTNTERISNHRNSNGNGSGRMPRGEGPMH